MRSVVLASSLSLLIGLVSTTALADEVATPCVDTSIPDHANSDTCEAGHIAFSRDAALPAQGGFDTGFVPSGSPLQVHLFAQLYATTHVDMVGQLQASWPASLEGNPPSPALSLAALGTAQQGHLAIHYGVDIGAEAHLDINVLGDHITWTGPIPFVPQFDFQVDAKNAFDPWAFSGTAVEGETMQQTLAQVSASDFIGVDIPGLDGGFELDTKIQLSATYKTNRIVVTSVDGVPVEGGVILGETESTLTKYLGGPSVDLVVHPEGEVDYQGTLHLIPAFYIDTIGPDFSIPVADIPIPFSITQDDWVFDAATVHVPLPDIVLEGDGQELEGEPETVPTDPLEIDLGTIAVGEQSSKQIVIRNVGEASLVTGFSLDDSDHFTLQAGTASVAEGGEFDQLVVFTALEAGDFDTTIEIATNDPDEPLRTILVHASATDDGSGPPTIDEDVVRDDGCGCRVAGPTDSPFGAFAGIALGVAVIALRRRPRRQG